MIAQTVTFKVWSCALCGIENVFCAAALLLFFFFSITNKLSTVAVSDIYHKIKALLHSVLPLIWPLHDKAPSYSPKCALIHYYHWKEYSLSCSLRMSALKSLHKRATLRLFLSFFFLFFCSWSFRDTNGLLLSKIHCLFRAPTHTHTHTLHSHSLCTQFSIPTIKLGDRCWISFWKKRAQLLW